MDNVSARNSDYRAKEGLSVSYYTRDQIIEIVTRIQKCEYTSEDEADKDIDLLIKGVLDPQITDYIFGDELSPEEIADKALAYQPIIL